MSATETWTDDGERFAVIDYDDRGVAQVAREALHTLLERAGFTQAPIPETEFPRDGRERLRNLNAPTPPADECRAEGRGA